jgi:hypothetical protein
MKRVAPKSVDAYLSVRPDQLKALQWVMKIVRRCAEDEEGNSMAYGDPSTTAGGWSATAPSRPVFSPARPIAVCKKKDFGSKTSKGTIWFTLTNFCLRRLIRK